MNVIRVLRLADFPTEPVHAMQGKSIEEAEAWAKQHKAADVWVYVHKPNRAGVQLVTAVRLVVEEAKRIERVSADLVSVAEAVG